MSVLSRVRTSTRVGAMSAMCAVLFAAAAGGASQAFAHDYKAGAVVIHHPHARATVPGQVVGAGYLTLLSKGRADRLLSASAKVSEGVEIHTMSVENDVMRMRQVDGVELPPDRLVEFKPGGLHLMFVGLKAPLKLGDRFPMQLRFAKGGSVTVDVVVQAVNTAMPAAAKPSGKAASAAPAHSGHHH
ncbi:MAG: hypothetical protein RLZZ618_1429 [Pseudomonadota bacterium]|jgi:periplasmic copper chaperone A